MGIKEYFGKNLKVTKAIMAEEFKQFGKSIVDNFRANPGKVVVSSLILGGGLGRPGITTDTAAAQRAIDLKCEVILKMSTIDGVYDKDPNIYPEAIKYKNLSFDEAIEKNLKIMDKEAFEKCRKNNIPIIIFSMNDLLNIKKVIEGEEVGTEIR
jgi:uridylate kinase